MGRRPSRFELKGGLARPFRQPPRFPSSASETDEIDAGVGDVLAVAEDFEVVAVEELVHANGEWCDRMRLPCESERHRIRGPGLRPARATGRMHRCALLGFPHGAEAALANLLLQPVAPDAFTSSFKLDPQGWR